MSRLVVVKLGGNAALAVGTSGRADGARGARLHRARRRRADQRRWLASRGIEPRFVGGRRVTDQPMLACVREGLAAVSDELCAALRAAGLEPVAFADGVVDARRVPSWGSWASPPGRAADAIEAALGGGLVPVVAPLGTRRRRARSSTSTPTTPQPRSPRRSRPTSSSSSPTCPACSTSSGAVLSQISASRPPASASGGMLPKLEACTTALLGGVARVTIGIAGTVVTP